MDYPKQYERIRRLALQSGEPENEFCIKVLDQLNDRIPQLFREGVECTKSAEELRTSLVVCVSIIVGCQFRDCMPSLPHYLFLYHQTTYGKEHPLAPLSYEQIFQFFAHEDVSPRVMEPLPFESFPQPKELNPLHILTYWRWKNDKLQKLLKQNSVVMSDEFSDSLTRALHRAAQFCAGEDIQLDVDLVILLCSFIQYSRPTVLLNLDTIERKLSPYAYSEHTESDAIHALITQTAATA